MTVEEILELNNEVITLEQLEEIEDSQDVGLVEFNGMSGQNECKWYTVYLGEEYVKENCDDSNEIQVYVK